MDTLQEQVNILSSKVDALSRRIEQLGTKLSDVVVECKFGADQLQQSESDVRGTHRSYAGTGYRTLDATMEHKDILIDSNAIDSTIQSGERQLSPEVQIQRLTAQLTAAYNRIAALEEQLLSKRIH